MLIVKNKPITKRNILIVSLIISLLSIFGLVFSVSTTIKVLDWILLTSCYFSICLMLWHLMSSKMKIVKYTSIVLMILVFGIGYFSATFGILGVGFILGDFDTNNEIWLNNGLIYKETSLGNAVSDYRGKRVEIYRTIKWLPILEWRIEKKEYFNVIPYLGPLTVYYKPVDKMIFLSAKDTRFEEPKYWYDTIRLK